MHRKSKIMKRLTTACSAACLACFALTSVQAQQNFLTDPLTPYPPGCATNSEALGNVPGRETEITGATLTFYTIADTVSLIPSRPVDIDVSVIRRGCAEADRSLILVDLDFPGNDDGSTETIPLPTFSAERFGVEHGLRGVVEPNTWSATGGTLAEGRTVRLFLDGPGLFEPDFDPDAALTPEEYNGDWSLLIQDDVSGNAYRVAIPEYRNQLQEDRFVLNGRLSGIWWVDGIPDQGIFLGFHERANQDSAVVFFSWNTFGPDGENLWFSGTGDYQLGDREVVIDMVWVRDGEFMGTKPAERSSAGSVTVTANGCNDLTLSYDLDFPGLSSGTRRLQRPFSLETQGFACRDRQARLEALD
jgi:hypothetical protein